MDIIDILILILAGLYLAFYVAKLGYKVYRFVLIKIKYRKAYGSRSKETQRKKCNNPPSPCQSCSREQWAECFRKGKACERLLLWARNLK